MTTTSTESEKSTSPDCLELLYLVLDEEATEEQKSNFKEHIRECMPCYKSYNLDMKIKELIKQKCCGKHVTQEFIDSVKTRVLEQTQS